MTTRNITFKAKWIKILSTVPASLRAQYVAAIYEYMLNGTVPKDLHMQVGFAFFKEEIDRAARARARRNNNPDDAENTPDTEASSGTSITVEQEKEMAEDKKKRCDGCSYITLPHICESHKCKHFRPNDYLVVNSLSTNTDNAT